MMCVVTTVEEWGIASVSAVERSGWTTCGAWVLRRSSATAGTMAGVYMTARTLRMWPSAVATAPRRRRQRRLKLVAHRRRRPDARRPVLHRRLPVPPQPPPRRHLTVPVHPLPAPLQLCQVLPPPPRRHLSVAVHQPPLLCQVLLLRRITVTNKCHSLMR